jgi:SAM-dependent methyltransferase
MNLERLKFGLMYRLGFVPWDGHKLVARMVELVEGKEALPRGRAIDLGCGTGDSSLYLASHGWDVVGIDFVERALKTARAKAEAARVTVKWLRADVTKLAEAGLGDGFSLAIDNGCLHLLSDADRDRYVRALSAIAGVGATLLVVGLLPGRRGPGPRGIDRAEIERRFAPGWVVVGEGPVEWSTPTGEQLQWYELRKQYQVRKRT